MAGLEPATSAILRRFTNLASRHPYMLCKGSCRCPTLPKILGYLLRTYSRPLLLISFIRLKIPLLPWFIQPTSTLHSSLGLTLLPIPCPSAHRPTRERPGFGTYLVSLGCTYGLNTVSFHSICCEVSFDAVSRRSLLMRFTR